MKMSKHLKVLSVVVLLGALSACRPGPIDPPANLDHNRFDVNLEGVELGEESPLDRINVASLWNSTTGLDQEGKRVVIGLVGTGIDYTNSDLRNALWINNGELSDGERDNDRDDDGNGYADDLLGYDFADGDGKPYDWHGFDTFVAGLLVGSGEKHPEVRGIAPNAELLVARYLDSDGRGHPMDASLAIRYAADQGARVIYFNWPNGGFGDGWNEKVVSSIAYAGQKNAMVVMGAGNDSNQDVAAFISNQELRQMEHVLIVSAQDADGKVASYSNQGRDLAEIAAPVEGSQSYTSGGYLSEALPSTSVAAAYVTGVAALLSTQPGMSRAKDVRDYLLKNAKIPESGRLEVLAGGGLYVGVGDGS